MVRPAHDASKSALGNGHAVRNIEIHIERASSTKFRAHACLPAHSLYEWIKQSNYYTCLWSIDRSDLAVQFTPLYQ